jgi:hypothetical protein
MAVFDSRESAEEFIEGDPFVAKGLVASWRIEDCCATASRPPASTALEQLIETALIRTIATRATRTSDR